MTYDTEQLLKELVEQFDGYVGVDLQHRTVLQMMDGRFTWLTTADSQPDPQLLKLMLLRIPLPRVYCLMRPDGCTLDVISGGNLVDTLRHFTSDEVQSTIMPGTMAFAHNRKILATEVDIVVFRAFTSMEDAMRLIKMVDRCSA